MKLPISEIRIIDIGNSTLILILVIIISDIGKQILITDIGNSKFRYRKINRVLLLLMNYRNLIPDIENSNYRYRKFDFPISGIRLPISIIP